MKVIRFHKQVIRELEYLDIKTKQHLTDLLALLAVGESIAMPISRPMPSVTHGAHELRIKDKSGQYRIFYFTKVKDAVMIFHMFKKKTEATPKQEIETGLKRLKEMI